MPRTERVTRGPPPIRDIIRHLSVTEPRNLGSPIA
jgi:hypothetical protein